MNASVKSNILMGWRWLGVGQTEHRFEEEKGCTSRMSQLFAGEGLKEHRLEEEKGCNLRVS